MSVDKVEEQIKEKQKTVDYDVKEFTIEIIVSKYLSGFENDENEIFIPSYQREFVWDNKRQSRFIESVILGLPIPYIFTADTEEGRLEIVDGTQRVRTLSNFLNNTLRLESLEILSNLNGMFFKDFGLPRQRKIRNVSLRMIVLSDKSDDEARFMLFERLNTGSELLNSMEKRTGSYTGDFTDFLNSSISNIEFRKATKFTPLAEKRREPQELLLRFFAYSDHYLDFNGNVNDFMNGYIKHMNSNDFNSNHYTERLTKTMRFVNENFPNGFVKKDQHNSTPRGRFEALSVGTCLALQENPKIQVSNVKWLDSKEFEGLVTGGSTNTRSKVIARIEFVKNKLTAKS